MKQTKTDTQNDNNTKLQK